MNGSGFPLDLVFWALVAGFLLLRLRAVLGRTDEADLARRKRAKVPMAHTDRPARGSEDGELLPEERAALAHRGLEETIAAIRRIEPDFSLARFLEGARAFYAMVLEAYWTGDRETLRQFLTPDVYEDFVRAIDEREAAGEQIEGHIAQIDRITVEDVRLHDSDAEIDLRFVAEIAVVTKDREGRVLAGDPEQAQRVEDLWTLTRRLGSPDPNWTLSATHSEDDA